MTGELTNGVAQWIIRYRYKDQLDRTYDGKSPSVSPLEAENWKKGAIGTIKYDRAHSDKSEWLGASGR